MSERLNTQPQRDPPLSAPPLDYVPHERIGNVNLLKRPNRWKQPSALKRGLIAAAWAGMVGAMLYGVAYLAGAV